MSITIRFKPNSKITFREFLIDNHDLRAHDKLISYE